MIDVTGLAPVAVCDVKVFNALPDVNSWQQWVKPRNCGMIYMMCWGAGGGGGGGLSGADNTARGGGAGGGSGAITSAIIPAIMVPDFLYVNVGIGGNGGAAGGAGSSGNLSWISCIGPLSLGNVQAQLVTHQNGVYLVSGGVAAAGGGAGTTTTSTGGAGETVSTVNSGLAGSMGGMFQTVPGQTGSGGGSGAGNNNGSNAPSPSPRSGISPAQSGAGGASCGAGASTSQPGGRNVQGVPWTAEGQQGGLVAVNNGNAPNGWTVSLPPFFGVAGCGGASIHAGVGGAGGAGGLSSGGGGGGAGVTGGAGGKGGDGMVIIVAW